MLGVVIVAAGQGVRLGSSGPKALVEVAGHPLIWWAAHALDAAELPPATIVHPAGAASMFAEALNGIDTAGFVDGGATRSDSVRAGVAALPAHTEVIVVHDAARPFMPPETIIRAVGAVEGDVLAAAPGLAVADTLKLVEGDTVVRTVERAHLVGVQTPQVFRRDALTHVLATGDSATDELALIEAAIARGTLDGRVAVVTGSVLGHKVTTADDLALVAELARVRP